MREGSDLLEYIQTSHCWKPTVWQHCLYSCIPENCSLKTSSWWTLNLKLNSLAEPFTFNFSFLTGKNSERFSLTFLWLFNMLLLTDRAHLLWLEMYFFYLVSWKCIHVWERLRLILMLACLYLQYLFMCVCSAPSSHESAVMLRVIVCDGCRAIFGVFVEQNWRCCVGGIYGGQRSGWGGRYLVNASSSSTER